MSNCGAAEFRPKESPPAWFVELLIAIDRGDFRRALHCQDQLARLGWCVKRRPQSRIRGRKGAAR